DVRAPVGLGGVCAFLAGPGVEPVLHRRGDPSTPNSARMAAARSWSRAAGLRSGRLVTRMPGTVSGSMQWSPLHSAVLSVTTSGISLPRADSFDPRVPLA